MFLLVLPCWLWSEPLKLDTLGDEAVEIYKRCPLVHESVPGVCEGCPLNQGIFLGDHKADTGVLTTLCPVVEGIEVALGEAKE